MSNFNKNQKFKNENKVVDYLLKEMKEANRKSKGRGSRSNSNKRDLSATNTYNVVQSYKVIF